VNGDAVSLVEIGGLCTYVTRSSPPTSWVSGPRSRRSARSTNLVRLSNSSGRASTTPMIRQGPELTNRLT